MLHDIRQGDPGEIIYLATREDGWQHLMLLGSRQDKDRVMGRLLQRLQESVESGRTQHMDLINDKDLILSDWGRDTHLLDQRADIVDRIVRRRIKLMDVI